jgi:hypothetical protein
VRAWCPAAHAALQLRGHDLYETPTWAVHALTRTGDIERLHSGGAIWEPTAGRGAIVRELIAAGYSVVASDLVAYPGTNVEIETTIDFLPERNPPADVSVVATSLPFRLADLFIRHGLSLGLPVVVLLRLMAFEGVGRSDLIDRHLRHALVGIERARDAPARVDRPAHQVRRRFPSNCSRFSPARAIGRTNSPESAGAKAPLTKFALGRPHDRQPRCRPGKPEISASRGATSLNHQSIATQLSAEEVAALTNADTFDDFPTKGPPWSGVVQSASKDLDVESPKFVPGAQPGLISLRFSRDQSKPVRSFDFTPFAVEPAFSVYEPTVGTMAGAYIETLSERPSEARWQTNASGKRQCLMPDGRVVKESRTVYMAVGARIIAFSVHSTGLAPIIDMLDRCKRFSVGHPSEAKPLRGPLISKWRMTTTERREGSYRWWIPNPELLGKLGEPGGPSIAEVRFAREARANFLGGGSLWDEAPALEAPRTGRLAEVTSGPAPRPVETAPSNDGGDLAWPGPGGPIDDSIPF